MVICHERAKSGRAKTAGLTLVEVLVVITMTGILSAIMLPALSTAKEKTRRAVCKSNLHQLLGALENYVDQNAQYLPSSADNKGYYHSIVMSDDTFTNLVDMAGGNSNIFYCPNVVFSTAPGAVAQHSPLGYVTGYSYLATNVLQSTKSMDSEDDQIRWPSVGTTELLADANYWTTSAGSGGSSPFPAQMKIAPHTPMGAAMMKGSSFTVGLPGNTSIDVGAVGGNIGFADMSVQWRGLPQMQINNASSPNVDSKGLW